ncbi:MAG: MaoC family dehydratase N-terminal domain-containing protein [Chloroflexota bacterium]
MGDRAIIGLSGPEFEVPIERGHIRQFAKAVGALLPDYLEDPRAVVPPTFLVMSAYYWGYLLERPGDTPLADLNVRHTLDAGQSFTFYGALPRAGDTLIAKTEVEDVWEKQGRNGGKLEFYKMLTSFRDSSSGDLVAEWRPISVKTAHVPTEAVAYPKIDAMRPYYDKDEPRPHFMAIPNQTWDDLSVGQGVGSITLPPLTLTDVARYAFASGEDSVAHYDDAAAQAEGYPSWFSIGMFHAGLLATYAVQWLGPDQISHFEARFNDMIWPADSLSYEGTVVSKREAQNQRFVDIELQCTRDGIVVTRGKATFRVE